MEKIIKAESARGQNYIDLFNKVFTKSMYYSVRNFYNNPSIQKIAAENKILQKSELKAYRVLGGNSSTFTAGWLDNENRLHIETRENSYVII